MKRLVLVAVCACICTLLALTIVGGTATPSWSQLDQTVTVSPGPISDGCFQLCSHTTHTCVSTSSTWTCVTQNGSCSTLFNCIGQ
jgi:hypothetical protein